jgi:hypothetical protein
MSITHLQYQDIDKEKWDRCIRESHNGLIYSTSLYLDHVAGQWDALILDDYEAVMPLPWRKKWGINYVYPPAFTQQLGITSRISESVELVNDFIESIPKKFPYLEMNFNVTNPLPTHAFVARKNYILSLSPTYKILGHAYSRSARRNIAKAKSYHLHIVEQQDPGEIISMHRQRFKDAVGNSADDYTRFATLVKKLIANEQCYCIAAKNKKGELVAGSIYTIFKNRITFILNGNTEDSLTNGATHLLMDFTINKFSEKNYLLDFEGSDQPSFARFYEQYGAKAETYALLQINNLPFPLSIFKPPLRSGHV